VVVVHRDGVFFVWVLVVFLNVLLQLVVHVLPVLIVAFFPEPCVLERALYQVFLHLRPVVFKTNLLEYVGELVVLVLVSESLTVAPIMEILFFLHHIYLLLGKTVVLLIELLHSQ